jgi:cytochrome c biogenesis protein ResB
MPGQALKITAAAILSMSLSGCIMEAYDSQARSDAKSWIGEPIQKVAKRFGQPDAVSSGDAGKTKYVWKEYENYSNDYNYTYYEQGQGMTPNSTVLTAKTGTGNQSGYYTGIDEFYADASGTVGDATARGECR